ncbi:protein phosphatase 2C domain-containing protein [Plectonema radiosum NIES-515]|uniref:Protein phosphatase 2C domain-containing protein n=1 Tax=Plectonema radiosum NIES-515 TaxID=2986073 RepID=A0ABT3B7X7_9CYAN|nr:PP2C family serine/threonine-protein phosphatase [Plectonema radiosum]MCV3217444.1 protein phosphatase 2C domain-containing protein [Plectonema radiosum NIES-515]
MTKKTKIAKKVKEEKGIRLTIEEFSELQRKYPDSIEALNHAISKKLEKNIYIKLMELHHQQKKLGNDAVPDALIKEIKSKKENNIFQKSKQGKNNALAQENDVESVEDRLPNPEEDEAYNVNVIEDQNSEEDIIPQPEEDGMPEQIEWQGIYATTVGRSHLQSHPQVECQDAAKAVSTPRAAIFVADGAGSARFSQFGSKAVVEGLGEFTNSMESIHQQILDQEQRLNCNESNEGKEYAYRFIKSAIETLRELSKNKECLVDDLKCTLLMAVLGKHYLFWLKVGDGFIVVEKDNKLELLGSLGKGEFANQTTFLSDRLKDEAIYYGFLPIQNVTGIAAFTDGAAETLVSMDGSKIAGALSNFFAETRGGSFDNDSLLKFLEDETVWASPKGLDDRGIALLA